MRRLLCVLIFLGVCAPADAALRLVKQGTFDTPVYVAAPPKAKRAVYVVEKAGVVRGLHNHKVLLDIRDRVLDQDEQGLFSIAFAPDYAKSKRYYAFFTAKDGAEHVEEFRAGDGAASAREVLVEEDPEANNNGGQLQFGPDNLLYIANGDGGGEEAKPGDRDNHAQDLSSLFGKILRIDPRASGAEPYTVPADNPFQASGQAPEIYLYGVRNPWRFSFDSKTGALIVGDVGRGEREEIDYFKRGEGRGANLGWRPYEGTTHYYPDESAPGAVAPVLEFNHTSDNWCAVTGGYVSRDPKVKQTFGRYLFGDLCRGDILSARLRQPTSTARRTGLHVEGLVSFGQDGRKRLYAMGLGGDVFRIAKAA